VTGGVCGNYSGRSRSRLAKITTLTDIRLESLHAGAEGRFGIDPLQSVGRKAPRQIVLLVPRSRRREYRRARPRVVVSQRERATGEWGV
jgi:hypothetical protein